MRRFIAGAVCPECRALDRIVVEEHEGGRRRRCVCCGYVDVPDRHASVTPATRFSRQPTSRSDDSARAVRIIDPKDQER